MPFDHLCVALFPQICDANASLLDESTATAEAMPLCVTSIPASNMDQAVFLVW